MDPVVLRGVVILKSLSTVLLFVCLGGMISIPLRSARAQSAEWDVFVYLPLVIRQGGTFPPSPDVVVNGDFEGGRTGWVEYGEYNYADAPSFNYALIVPAEDLPSGAGTSITPHEGDWAVWLGGDAKLTTHIEQEITVPETGSELVYWHWIDSIFACDGSAGGVKLNGDFVDSYTLCASADTGGWERRSVDLTAYAGQTVQLRFVSQTEADNYSSLYIDTVSVQETP